MDRTVALHLPNILLPASHRGSTQGGGVVARMEMIRKEFKTIPRLPLMAFTCPAGPRKLLRETERARGGYISCDTPPQGSVGGCPPRRKDGQLSGCSPDQNISI